MPTMLSVVPTPGAFIGRGRGSSRYVVRVCVDEFKRTRQQDPRHTIAASIHEMLHTLGLGENPPTSNDITTTVRTP